MLSLSYLVIDNNIPLREVSYLALMLLSLKGKIIYSTYTISNILFPKKAIEKTVNGITSI